jgi:hypothetical protein
MATVEYSAILRAIVGRKRMRPKIRSEIPTPSASPTLGASANSEQRMCRGVGRRLFKHFGSGQVRKVSAYLWSFLNACGYRGCRGGAVCTPGHYGCFRALIVGVSTILFVGGLVAKEFATGFMVV